MTLRFQAMLCTEYDNLVTIILDVQAHTSLYLTEIQSNTSITEDEE